MPDAAWPRVAFQGERGAYSEDAIQQLWGGRASPIPSWSFPDVIQAVTDGSTEYGIIPIHNTVVGKIQSAVDALAAAPHLLVIDETTIDIRHAVLASRGATYDTIRCVMSHPVALAQCGQFLARYPAWTIRESYDTAGAARDVAARGLPYLAAIASVRAAERYQLAVIAENIQDVAENRTRFLVIAQPGRGEE